MNEEKMCPHYPEEIFAHTLVDCDKRCFYDIMQEIEEKRKNIIPLIPVENE